MELAERVQRFVQEHNLLQAGWSVVVGVSGGPDSLCLLDLLHRLAPAWDLRLQIAHLNHGLRPEAAAEANMVRAEASRRGLPFFTAEVDTRAHAEASRLSIEEAARELRYGFLAKVAGEARASVLAVAHTADDQAETVLMHFLRGSGLAGLQGMRPQSTLPPSPVAQASGPLVLIRPLLGTTRAEVEAYCAEHDLHPAHDVTNLDRHYLRNRLRHDLLPELEKYNPNVRANLCRTAAVLSGEYELLRVQVDALWQRTARLEPEQVVFDRAQWQTLSPPEQRALLREAVTRLRQSARDIDFDPIEGAVQFSRQAGTGRSCEVLGGLTLAIGYTALTLSAGSMPGPTPEELPLLSADGQLSPGWQFCVTALDRESSAPLDDLEPANAWQADVDAALVFPPLRLRARRAGDAFCPLGLAGHRQKVSDYMVNVKLEAAVRDRWPLVVSGDDIVWLAGLRLDERFKVTAATRRMLRLELKKSA